MNLFFFKTYKPTGKFAKLQQILAIKCYDATLMYTYYYELETCS